MKNQVINQTELQAKNKFNEEFYLKRVVVAEVEYDNGTTGELMTFIGKETEEEVIVSGLTDGLKRQNDVSSVKFTVCSVSEVILKPFMFYERIEFGYEEKMEATNGGYFYYLKSKERKARNDFMKKNDISYHHTSNYAYTR